MESRDWITKARHDEAQALHHARREAKQEEKFEIARNLKNMGMPFEQIERATNLKKIEIEKLKIQFISI